MTRKSKTPGKTTPAKPRRRSFLNLIWAILGLLACVEVGWITGRILKTRKKRAINRNALKVVDVGQVDTLAPGSVTAVPEGQFYLARLDDNSFIALSRTCTHLGCSVPWDEKHQQFICPCHGSKFDLTGAVLSPPAVRPLDYYPVRIENGLVRVDISRPHKRETFEPSQTTRI